jgi:hypothetical protein
MLLNDYFLQLDGAPLPPSPIFTGMYESYSSCSPTALDRTCCKWRQPHTHTTWDEFDYRVDVCRVTQGAHIEGLWLMHKKLGQLPLLTLYVLPVKVRNKFLVNFWNCTILLCIPCIFTCMLCSTDICNRVFNSTTQRNGMESVKVIADQAKSILYD